MMASAAWGVAPRRPSGDAQTSKLWDTKRTIAPQPISQHPKQTPPGFIRLKLQQLNILETAMPSHRTILIQEWIHGVRQIAGWVTARLIFAFVMDEQIHQHKFIVKAIFYSNNLLLVNIVSIH